MAYSYGIPDGTYTGRPTTASCYEKDGRLILDVNFAVKDPNTGAWYKKDNGYDWEARKRHWLTSADGAFNEKTIEGRKEWAKGWQPRSLDDFWWFQNPDANGTPFGNLIAIGEVELNFATDGQGNQTIWVHDPDRPKSGGRKAYVPDGASSDRAAMMAKWGTRAKALFAATPKKVGTGAPAQAAPKPGGRGWCCTIAPCGGPCDPFPPRWRRSGEAVGVLSADRGRSVRLLLLAPGRAVRRRKARRKVVRAFRCGAPGEGRRRVHAGGHAEAVPDDQGRHGRMIHNRPCVRAGGRTGAGAFCERLKT